MVELRTTNDVLNRTFARRSKDVADQHLRSRPAFVDKQAFRSTSSTSDRSMVGRRADQSRRFGISTGMGIPRLGG